MGILRRGAEQIKMRLFLLAALCVAAAMAAPVSDMKALRELLMEMELRGKGPKGDGSGRPPMSGDGPRGGSGRPPMSGDGPRGGSGKPPKDGSGRPPMSGDGPRDGSGKPPKDGEGKGPK